MFKLFVNNVQIGNYKSLKQMVNAIAYACSGKAVVTTKWTGNSFFVKIK